MNHKLTIKGIQVELTTAEAKALLAELAAVFAEKTPIVIERDRIVPWPIFHQPVPQWTPDVPYCLPSVTC